MRVCAYPLLAVVHFFEIDCPLCLLWKSEFTKLPGPLQCFFSLWLDSVDLY